MVCRCRRKEEPFAICVLLNFAPDYTYPLLLNVKTYLLLLNIAFDVHCSFNNY